MLTEPSALPRAADATAGALNGKQSSAPSAGASDAGRFNAAEITASTGQSAAAMESAIRLALARGAHVAARELSQVAVQLHPHSDGIRLIAQVLAPPRAQRTGRHTDASRRRDTDWLRDNWRQHRDQWVAIRDGQLLGAAPSLQELKQQLAGLAGAFVTHIS